jgi:FlaA1/EpsC-like NDP-sugar epimerase
MGTPVRIVDLIRNFASMLNIRHVNFQFTGLRPGEKLSEELFGSDEMQLPTDHPKVSMACPVPTVPAFRAVLNDLYDAASHNRPDEVMEHMCRLVPEYTPPLRAMPVLASASPYPDDY